MIDTGKTSSRCLPALVLIVASFLAFCPTVASAATVNVMVANNCFCFSPPSVTIHRGDTVRWTWSSGGYYSPMHSSTSGTAAE
jgi:plastocyanin